MRRSGRRADCRRRTRLRTHTRRAGRRGRPRRCARAARAPRRRAERAAVGVREMHAERLQHARAAVVRRAAAEADDEAPRARVERRTDQLARAPARRDARIARVGRHEMQAARLGHLDHRGAVGQDAERGARRPAERIGDARAAALAARGRDECVHRAFTAVGDRQASVVGIGEHLAEPGLDLPRRFDRGQAFLERIGSNHDLHQRTSSVTRAARALSMS